MRILVVGFGSIGRRHATNLAAMAAGELFVVEPDHGARSAAASFGGVSGVFEELEDALGRPGGYDVGLITTPTHLHAAQASRVLEHCRALFVEKPLSDRLDGLADLCAKARRLVVPTMVGCNMRFYPTLRRMHELLSSSYLGDPLYGRVRFGYYLPSWRPGRDYREIYSSRAAQGGGIILDDIHEIDLACHFLGPFKEFQVMGGRLSDLEIDVEDVASIQLRNDSGAIVSILMDYIHPLYQREFEVVGSGGALRWREEDNLLAGCRHGDKNWHTILKLEDFDYNEIYKEELSHFLACVKDGREPMNGFDEAAAVLALSLDMRKTVQKRVKRNEDS